MMSRDLTARERGGFMGGFVYWILVGLIAGWLAGKVMKGGGYGVLADIVLGILGGFVGGGYLVFLASMPVGSSVRLWSLL